MLRERSNWTVMRRGAERIDRGHLGHAGDLAEPALERSRDRGGHGLGIGARPAGGDAMVGNSTDGRLATGRKR